LGARLNNDCSNRIKRDRGETDMKKYKFINIKQVDNELFEKHPVYRIFNNKSGGQLGILSFYKPWKEYVFSSQPECVFNNGCLKDVLDFINVEIPKLKSLQ
jgi:hypothetical protein